MRRLRVFQLICIVLLSMPRDTCRSAEPLTDGLIREKQDWLWDRLGVNEAWETSKGSSDTLIGVIDNGYDFYHPDLRGKLTPGIYYSGGYHSDTYENIGHGTLVSSLIVASDDDRGMRGLAPGCRVLTASQGSLEHALLRIRSAFFKQKPEANEADFQQELRSREAELKEFGERWIRYQLDGAADAIRYMADRDVRVINLSGFVSENLCSDARVWQNFADALDYASGKDIVFVIAAGNHAESVEDYPGTRENVLIAGACTNDGKRWNEEIELRGIKVKQGTCYGNRLSVVAPVEDLVVCAPHDKKNYGRMDGPLGPSRATFQGPHLVLENGATSSAAPIVTSLVALVRSFDPGLDAKTTIRLVCEGCDDLADPGYDPYTGHGMVNFARTIELAKKIRSK